MIAIDSFVTPKRGPAAATVTLSAPPTFGRILDGVDPWTVLWDNGNTAFLLDEAFLDEVIFIATLPQIVRVNLPAVETAEYDAKRLAIYSRKPGGVGLATTYCLAKSLQHDVWFDLPATAYDVLENR